MNRVRSNTTLSPVTQTHCLIETIYIDMPGISVSPVGWLAKFIPLEDHKTHRYVGGTTYIRRHPRRQRAAWYTSSLPPRTESLTDCRRRHYIGNPWHVGANHLSNRRRSLRAANIHPYTFVIRIIYPTGAFLKTNLSFVLHTNGCEPSSGHMLLSLKGRVCDAYDVSK